MFRVNSFSNAIAYKQIQDGENLRLTNIATPDLTSYAFLLLLLFLLIGMTHIYLFAFIQF